MGQLALDIQVPDLYVSQAVVRVNRIIVGHETRGPRESVGQSQVARCGVPDRIGLRVGKRRLEREVLDDGAVLRQVVVDSVAEPDDGEVQRLPGQTKPRSKVV